jgi:hypothetical protein
MGSALRVKACVPRDSQFERAAYLFERLEEPWVDTDWRRERGSQQSLDCAVIRETGEITSTLEQAWQQLPQVD